MTDILQVITSNDRRGAELRALDLEQGLNARGYVVRTIALAPGRHDRGLPVPTIGARRLGAATLRALRGEAHRADLVIAFGSTTLPACAIALVGTGTPFVYRSIGDPTYWGTTRARRLRSTAFLRRARVVVALAEPIAAELSARYRVAPGKVRVIPQAVAADRFAPADAETRRRARARFALPDTAPVVLYLGALSAEKNVPLGIEAVARLPEAHLLVVGDGPERREIEARAAQAAPDRVHVVGAMDGPEVAFAAADAVLLSSRTEGLPAALIEAGYCGLPVVTTDVGCVREIVADGKTGFVVPSGDAEALAGALARALRDRDALGRAARIRCRERFSIETVSAAWDELVTSILDRRPDPRDIRQFGH